GTLRVASLNRRGIDVLRGGFFLLPVTSTGVHTFSSGKQREAIRYEFTEVALRQRCFDVTVEKLQRQWILIRAASFARKLEGQGFRPWDELYLYFGN
ncbi:hypothetical protein K0M31_017510, partial [Melipona bicolor]